MVFWRELLWWGNPQCYIVRMSQCKRLSSENITGHHYMISRNLSPLHDYSPWMVDCHNAYHILWNSREFHYQIGSHEGCISFHAVECCDLALSLTTLQSSVNLPCKISVIPIKGRLWHKKLPHMITIITVHSTHYPFSDWLKTYSKCSKSAPGTSSSCRLYNNHVKGTQGHG